MSRVAYVNGHYRPIGQAEVSIEDRGYQFADGVYEVCEVRGGRLVDEERHLIRLQRSLDELSIAVPMPLRSLSVILREIVRRNRIRNGIVYIQVTRGVARRNHAFPDPAVPPSLVVAGRSITPAASTERAENGVTVITVPENRWERVDIKTVALLPNVLAKEAARKAGADEAWFVDRDGFVTEGSSSNAWIVTADGILVTAAADRGILRGITRHRVLDVSDTAKLRVEERRFTKDEAYSAQEAFLTSASSAVMPVVRIDDHPIGSGKPGPLAKRLRTLFFDNSVISPVYVCPIAEPTVK